MIRRVTSHVTRNITWISNNVLSSNTSLPFSFCANLQSEGFALLKEVQRFVHVSMSLSFIASTKFVVSSKLICFVSLREILIQMYSWFVLARWQNVKPRFEDTMLPFDESKFKETFGYLSCDCFPSCSDVRYSVQSSSIPLSLTELSWGRYETCTKFQYNFSISISLNK